MKTADIPDTWFLQVVDMLSLGPYATIWPKGSFGSRRDADVFAFALRDPAREPHWVMRWDIERLYKIPEKLVLSKARKLIKRGLLDGCGCGCRGDFVLTAAGRAALATEP